MISFRVFLLEDYANKRGCRYWGDAGSGVLPFAQDTGRFGVSHRGTYVNEGGTFGIFGGGIFLDQYGLEDVEELINSTIPQEHAKEELREETGYNGPVQLKEVYVFKDTRPGPKGKPCNFYYWNYVGIVPHEFPISPEDASQWEEGGQSGWLTFEELMKIEPKHFGLKTLLDNATPVLQQLAKQHKKKEPWEMTAKEYANFWRSNPAYQQEVGHFPTLRHKMEIRKALEAGKIIPPEVLKDYPDLRRKK